MMDLIEQWWADLFDVPRSDLWGVPSVRSHTVLGEYEGWYVAWRDRVGHASAPRGTALAPSLSALAELATWTKLAEKLGQQVVGPSEHAYLATSPGLVDRVEPVNAEELLPLREAVPPAEWTESGFGSLADGDLCFALERDGVIAAAANLSHFAGEPRDVGLLVAPQARGRGLGRLVARHAAAYAVEHSGVARWRAHTTNRASLAVAHSLGFTRYCTQLAVRPRAAGSAEAAAANGAPCEHDPNLSGHP